MRRSLILMFGALALTGPMLVGCAGVERSTYLSKTTFSDHESAQESVLDALEYHAFETQKPRFESGYLAFLKQFHDSSGKSMEWREAKHDLHRVMQIFAPEKVNLGWRVSWRRSALAEESFTFDTKEAATRFADGWSWLVSNQSKS